MFLSPADAVSSSAPGTPCWVDLATPDTAAACEFYGRLLGWDLHVKDDPVGVDGRYVVAYRDDVQVAGLYLAAPKDPVGWSLHLRVTGATNTAQWVEHLGGTVRLGPLDIPERGALLHATDPSGAPVVFWQPPPGWIFGTQLPGMFCGADLNTYDGAAADDFYGKLFGYSIEQIGSDGIDYAVWRLGHESVLYRCVLDGPRSQTAPPAAATSTASTVSTAAATDVTASPHWLVYFEADPQAGTDALAYTAISLGGGVLVEPHDTPFGRAALLLDPSGSPFAVIDHSRPVDLGVGRAEVDDPYDD
ncbi:VOC family protein [Saccharomonospora azurea]|uniref:Lactoylglutathione lyase family protein n=1 Tax=Saccharomonospora azurea NA-128 TaxID=882081 RepID=H8GB82_9PSEU|nr:VOC family protein [Saccharomonospora azurea]EHY90705.1 lactoylglutathione lyase family protein [Saccharomonospora azurea NA-128]